MNVVAGAAAPETREQIEERYEQFIATMAEKYGLSIEITKAVQQAFWSSESPLCDHIMQTLNTSSASMQDFFVVAQTHDLSKFVEVTNGKSN